MKVQFVSDIWTALTMVPRLLMSKQLVAIATREAGFLVISAREVTPSVILELENYSTRFVSIDNKATKTLLSASEAKYLNERIREARAWLN
jgi:hypothetical protein